MSPRRNNPEWQPELLEGMEKKLRQTPEEQAEKERYRQRLADVLKDPAFRQIEGFPIASDDAIRLTTRLVQTRLWGKFSKNGRKSVRNCANN